MRTGFRAALRFPLLAFVVAAAFAADPRPNILFILTDDQGWSSLSCYGSTRVPTPHLDQLAREGSRFTDAYVMSQCTPTRAALLTGQHTARNRMWHVIGWYGTPWARVREPAFRENLERDAFTLPKGLRAAGYATGIAGKWHLTGNADGSYVSLRPEAATHYGFDFSAPLAAGSQNEGDKQVNHLTDQAIDFIRGHRAHPWFFLLAHHTVHGVVSAPPGLVRKHLSAGAPPTGLHNATYLAALEHLDDSVGRLLAAVDELGLRQRTIVVFLSDNGGVFQQYDIRPFTEGPGTDTRLRVGKEEFSNAPLRAGKGSSYEGGIRVPCLVRWPGSVPAAAVIQTPVHVVDWAATFLAAAGAKPPPGHALDGADLAPLFRGGEIPPRALYWYTPFYELRWGVTPSAIIREGDWKLIESFGDHIDASLTYRTEPRLELFNLREDLGETRDLAASEPDRARRLREKLRAWITSTGAEIPRPNPHHDPARQLKETRAKPPHVAEAKPAP